MIASISASASVSFSFHFNWIPVGIYIKNEEKDDMNSEKSATQNMTHKHVLLALALSVCVVILVCACVSGAHCGHLSLSEMGTPWEVQIGWNEPNHPNKPQNVHKMLIRLYMKFTHSVQTEAYTSIAVDRSGGAGGGSIAGMAKSHLIFRSVLFFLHSHLIIINFILVICWSLPRFRMRNFCIKHEYEEWRHAIFGHIPKLNVRTSEWMSVCVFVLVE